MVEQPRRTKELVSVDGTMGHELARDIVLVDVSTVGRVKTFEVHSPLEKDSTCIRAGAVHHAEIRSTWSDITDEHLAPTRSNQVILKEKKDLLNSSSDFRLEARRFKYVHLVVLPKRASRCKAGDASAYDDDAKLLSWFSRRHFVSFVHSECGCVENSGFEGDIDVGRGEKVDLSLAKHDSNTHA